MSAPERRTMVDWDDPALPVVAQCRLLKIARSTLYYRPVAVDPDDLALMRRIDELYLASPFYGSRRMVAVLRREGLVVNRKRVRRLMRLMGLEAIYQKPNTSQGHPDHKVYPYLLRGLSIERANQVWCADITYIPVIAHPAPATASPGRLVDSTKWTASRTEARLALAVLTTERKAA